MLHCHPSIKSSTRPGTKIVMGSISIFRKLNFVRGSTKKIHKDWDLIDIHKPKICASLLCDQSNNGWHICVSYVMNMNPSLTEPGTD